MPAPPQKTPPLGTAEDTVSFSELKQRSALYLGQGHTAAGWLGERNKRLQRLSRLRGDRRLASTIADMASRKEDLESFVRRQSAADLAALLIELAQAHPEVRQRLERLLMADRPDKLAAIFLKPLKAWRRQSRHLDYRESMAWSTELEAWLSQVERELLPRDPMAAVSLAEAFIESDGVFMERADDSSGCIGGALRSACRLWLEAAARCEAPLSAWPDRLRRLFDADRYGTRELLLARADLLLDEPALRSLVADYEQQVDPVVSRPANGVTPTPIVHHAWAALTLLSQALRDPDIHVKATLRRSPRPNSMQKQDFVLRFLQADRPADALPWLEDSTDWYEPNRLRLLAEVHKRMGDTGRSEPVQRQVFELTLAVEDFRTWLEHLPPAGHAQAFQRARTFALDHQDPVVAARLLVEIEEHADAERVLVAEAARIPGQDYLWLVPLATALETHGRRLGATAVYRALLDAILAKAYAPAYRHGARYWHALHSLAEASTDFATLQPHVDYVAGIRKQHARKVAFWAQVGLGSRSPDAADDDDRT